MPADDTYTTLLNFVSDSSEANRDIKDTTENLKKMEEQTKKLAPTLENVSFPGDELSKDFELFEKAFNKSFKVVDGKMKDLRDGTVATTAELRKFANSSAEELNKAVSGIDLSQINADKIRENARQLGEGISKELEEGLRKGELTQADLFEIEGLERGVQELRALEEARKKELQTAIQAQQQKALLYGREATFIQRNAADIRQNAQILRNQAQQLQGISQLALGAGVGVVGGIFAFAAKYVQDAKIATETTKAWKVAQDSLTRSGQRTGEVFAQVALPLLQKAADVAGKASQFIERHPEIVQAALNAGLITAGLGAVGLAVSKGIRLYADTLYLASIPLQQRAGELQLAAAHEQLLAARIRAGAAPADALAPTVSKVAGGGALAAGLTSPAGIVALIAATGLASVKAADSLKQLQEKLLEIGGPATAPIIAFFETVIGVVNPLIVPIKNLRIALERDLPIIRNLIDQFTGGGKTGTRGVAGGRAGNRTDQRFASTEIREQAAAAYEDYVNDDLRLVQEHYADRQKVINDALRAEQQENAQYTASASKIRTDLSKNIGRATADFEREAIQSEQRYQLQRAQVIREGGVELERIEQDLQERLRKLRLEHEERNVELLAARDAVGLVKEQQRYARERAEETRQTNIQIGQRRADLVQRLQEMAQEHAIERQQRLEDFKVRIAEMQADAAERLRELQIQHDAELNQIRQARNERLREIDIQFVAERKRRYDQFIQTLRDLDAGLLGEKALRAKRQAEMLAELDKFLLDYKSRLATLSGATTGRAGGGYASYGNYLLGDAPGGGRGKPEYVLGGDLTELAERVLGGQLTQGKFINLLNALGGGNRNSVQYNDNRRIDSRVSNADRQRLQDDTLQTLSLILG